GPEDEPDPEVVAAEEADVEGEEEEDAETHPAREVQRAREPERARVERRHHEKVWVKFTSTPLTRSSRLPRSRAAMMLISRSITRTPPSETAFGEPEIQSA